MSNQTAADRCYLNHLKGVQKYRECNKEKIAIHMAEYYQKNKIRLLAYKRQKYIEKKESIMGKKNDM
jgi:hypothetical protein